MSTVRIQIRRGESTDWESIDPVLADGELGIEIDTNKMKVGNNGVIWSLLPYLNTIPTDLENTLGDYVLLADVGNANGPAKLDADGNLLIPKSSIILEGSSADAYETILTVTNPTQDRTITFPNASGTVVLSDGSGNVTVSGNLTVEGTTTTVNSTQVNIQNAFVFEGGTANDYETTLTTIEPTADRTISLPDNSGTIALTSDISELSQDAINDAITVANGLTINYVDPNNLLELGIDYNTIATTSMVDTAVGDLEQAIETLSGDINNALDDKAPLNSPTFTGTVSGVTAQMVGLGLADNTADLDKPVSTATQTALDLKANLANPTFTDSVVLPSNTTIGSVSATEIEYINGVTSSIQTQLDAKISAVDAQEEIDLKLSIADAETTYQTIVSGVSNTEIGYLDGVTGGIQGQIDDKAPIASPTFTGTVSGITKSMVGLGNVDDTSDVNKPVSTATQTELDLKAPLNSPTFTGTVTLPANTISQSMMSDDSVGTNEIGGSAVTEEKIANGAITDAKISATAAIAQSKIADLTTDLADKAPLASPTFTGTVTTGDIVINGDVTVNSGEFLASATSIVIEDNLIQLAHQNVANTVDLGVVVAYNDGTAKHSGIVRDVSTDKWKLFKGVTTEPSTTVDFTQGSLDNLAVAALEATTITPSSGVAFSDGTQTKQGVPSQTEIIQKTASYTLSSLGERDDLIEMGSSSPMTLTIPLNSAVAYPVGTSIDILQTSTGQVTIVGSAGVTVNATPGLKLRTQWSSATLFKRAEDTWVVYGDLTA